MKKLKSWHACKECNEELIGIDNLDDTSLWGITVMEGKCPYCDKNTTLIPHTDYMGTGD